MNASPETGCGAILALLDQALRDEERTTPPPSAEQENWLHGSAGFTDPDEHGWIAPVPPADVWVPRPWCSGAWRC